MTDNKTPSDTSEKQDKTAKQIMSERQAAQDKSAKDPAKPTTSQSPSQSSGKTKPNWSLRALMVLIIFLFGVGVGLYFLPKISDRLPIVAQWIGSDHTPDVVHLRQDIQDLKNRLAQQNQALETLKNATDAQNSRLAALEQRPGGEDAAMAYPDILARVESLEKARLLADTAPQDTTEDKAQAARIDMLMGRMSQLESSFVPLSKGLADAQTARLERRELIEANATQNAKLTQLDSRLQHVENYAARDTSGALLAFRIGALRHQISSGKAFADELSDVSSLTEKGSFTFNSGLSDSLGWLSQHQDGIPSAASVTENFDALIPVLIRNADHHADDPWWKRAYHSVTGLIMIRKTTPEGAVSLDQQVSAIQKHLAHGALSEAVTLSRELPQNLQPLLVDWQTQAQTRLQAEQEIARLTRLAASYYLTDTPKDLSTETPDAPTGQKLSEETSS
ncbi:hypothetical protein [Paremcibacter congregatus]|uniref:hypothetical protein n=1 Tax=Paremcibacter congregatus TaxID=2043170 RepID=UPI0030EDE1EC|tara:strand:- start:9091 stop:10440 length:1350 start_codon:yes stop_codon:yes gene_type:complete